MTEQAAASAAPLGRRIQNPSSWSLRRRLLVVVVVLFALLTAAVAIASVMTMRVVLETRVDEQLHELSDRTRVAVERAVATNTRQSIDPGGIPSGALIVVQDGDRLRDGFVINRLGQQFGLSSIDELVVRGVEADAATNVTLPTYGAYRVTTRDVGDLRVVVGLSLADTNQTLAALGFVIAVSAFAAVTIVLMLGDMIIRRALRPLTAVIATTERISQLPLASGDAQLTNRVRIEEPASEVGRVQESMNRMLNHIEEAFEQRALSERRVRQFVADASHELRTPLAAVRGYAEITRKHDTDLSDDSRASLERIEAAAHRMQALVDDLLLLARLDEGRELVRGEVDLSLVVVEAVADAQAAGRDHPIALELPEEPVVVAGDPLRLQQIIANLLANARVHTPPGTAVDVHLRAEEDVAVVDIVDAGPGIPPELQATVFERFARGDASRSRTAGSSGLGLAIVQALVEAHRGTIAMQSEPGRTAFTVRLPLWQPKGVADAVANADDEAADAPKAKGMRAKRAARGRDAAHADGAAPLAPTAARSEQQPAKRAVQQPAQQHPAQQLGPTSAPPAGQQSAQPEVLPEVPPPMPPAAPRPER
ncbi:sensor histidine kinase [Agrococcus carbonis]|uniref:histidine kinase n=1 Tax=Agrococcus carbonis TaxID=684552 RepID=A0A1H1MJP9_9MICO|nr:HAMP domain-containing sensor histidine kinase [Agrococcus carbonis]SDR86842.1 two-component system, OmpR family, sensor kinase [Agrococcus carbonis]